MSELANGWAFTTVGTVCKIVSGSTPRSTEPSFWGGQIPWITPDDLSRHTSKMVAEGRRSLTRNGYASCSTQMVPAGTVLYTSRAPIGYVAVASQPMCTNQGFKSLVPPEGLFPDYLYWYMRYATDEVRSRASGTTFAEISGRAMAEVPLLLAPFPEQERIVAAIEEHFSRLEVGVVALESALAGLQQLTTATIVQATRGDWPLVRLGDVADIALGQQRAPQHHRGEYPRPYIRAANVTWDGLNLADVKVMNFAPRDVAKFELRAGDVLLAEASGSASEVGRPVIWDGSIPGACFQKTLLRLRSDALTTEFLYYLFLGLARRGVLVKETKGVGIFHITKERLTDMLVPLPEASAQREAVATVKRTLEAARASADAAHHALARAATLRSAILAAAFSGQLVPQNPTDEPADILVRRLTANRTPSSRSPRPVPTGKIRASSSI